METSETVIEALQFCGGNPRVPVPPTLEKMISERVKPSLRRTVDYVLRLQKEIKLLREERDDAESRAKASEKTCAEQARKIEELQRTRITIKNLAQQTPRKPEICGAKMQVEVGGARFIVVCGETGTEEHGFRCVNHQCFAPALPLASDFVEAKLKAKPEVKPEVKVQIESSSPKSSYAAAVVAQK